MNIKKPFAWMIFVISVAIVFYLLLPIFLSFVKLPAKYLFKGTAVFRAYFSFPKIYREYLSLRYKQFQFTFYKNYVTTLEEENKRLRSLLRMKEPVGFENHFASVIYAAGSESKVFYINLGKEDGIDVGYGVVLPGNVVCGRVDKVWGHISRIVMLQAGGFSIAAMDESARVDGIVSAGDPVTFEFIGKQEMLSVGDVIRTSRLSVYFPEGYLIGEVSSYKCDKGGEQCWAKIEPCIEEIDFSEVIVLVPKGVLPR